MKLAWLSWTPLAGCALAPAALPDKACVDVAPATAAEAGGVLEFSHAAPLALYREMVAIDQLSVVRLVMAQNLELEQARLQVESAKTQVWEAASGLLPAVGPALLVEQVAGSARATQGNLLPASYTSAQPLLLAEWLLRPGQVIYAVLAARKRTVASMHQEREVQRGVLHRACSQYLALLAARGGVEVAQQGLVAAQELQRIAAAERAAGSALPADELRAQSLRAQREGLLNQALTQFHSASIALAQTLELDPRLTLSPAAAGLVRQALVRDELGVDELLELALRQRDDLAELRELAAAASHAASAAWWQALGPKLSASLAVGKVGSDAGPLGGSTSDWHQQESRAFGVGLTLDAGTLTQASALSVHERVALVRSLQQVAAVRAEVVLADLARQASLLNLAQSAEQLAAAEEVLRLTTSNQALGLATQLTVRQDEASLAQARQVRLLAQVAYNQAQLDLLAAVGGLTPQALGLPTP